MASQSADQTREEDLVFTCSECGSTLKVESVPHVGAALLCDCGDALDLGGFVLAFPEKWKNPGSFVERTFACRECDAEVRVDHVLDHWRDEHGRELVEEYHSWGPTHSCSECHHVFNLETNTTGALLHLDAVHGIRVFDDEFYEELDRRRRTPASQ